jgi:hypothetical protein
MMTANADHFFRSFNFVNVVPSMAGNLTVTGPGSGTEGTYVTASATFSDPAQGSTRSLQGAGSVYVYWGDGSQDVEAQSPGDLPLLTAGFSHIYAEPGTYQATFVAGYSENGTESVVYDMESANIVQNVPTLTVTGDTTATVTGDDYILIPTYTDIVGDHRTHDWTINWGDGVIKTYEDVGGTPAEFDHTYETAATSGTTYSPVLSVSAFALSGAVTATASVTVAQPEINVIQGDGTTLGQTIQHTTGGFIVYAGDDPDDVYDGSGNAVAEYAQTSLANPDPDLTEITLQALPASVGGTYSVAIPSDMLAYADQYKDTAVSSGQTYDATVGHTLWIEGSAISSQMGIDNFELDWQNGDAFASNVEYAHLAAVGITGPGDVPADGIYTYDVSGAVPQPAGSSPWLITGGTELTQSRGGNVCTVFWDSPTAGTPLTGGWFGDIQFTTANGVVVGPQRINVVQVIVATPTTEPAFGAGVPADNFHGVINGIDRKGVTSGSPGLKWAADITLNGPFNGATMLGISAIRVGFVQDKAGYVDHGVYAPGTLRSTLEAIYAEGYVHDSKSEGTVWYGDAGQQFANRKQTTNEGVIRADDSPSDGPPLGWLHNARPSPGEPLLQSMTLTDTFGLFVCAQTSDNGNHASQVYVERASATWVFNGSGTVAGGVWKGTVGVAKVTAPSSWTSVTNGTEPVTTGKTANYLSLSVEKFLIS